MEAAAKPSQEAFFAPGDAGQYLQER